MTTPPDFGVDHKLLVDWINSLEEPFRSFVTSLETNADPSGNIREAVCWKENAEGLAARVRELEAERDKYVQTLLSERTERWDELSIAQERAARLPAVEQKLITVMSDRDEWMQQHENLLGIYQSLVADTAILREKLEAANKLVRRWSNFDFDCPDEYNDETDEEECDGWALDKLYEDTHVHFNGPLKTPSRTDDDFDIQAGGPALSMEEVVRMYPQAAGQALEGARQVLRELNSRVVSKEEQAVLDALGELSEEWLRTDWCTWRKICDLELVRREAATLKGKS